MMGMVQQKIIEGGYSRNQIINLDETAVNWGLGPTHVYCAINADRGEQEITDTKARVTAIVMVAAEGDFLPLMYIFKHSKSSESCPDQTRMTVIKMLFKKDGFTAADGWELKEWQRDLTIEKKVKNVLVPFTALHKVTYIIHRDTGTIIFSVFSTI